jgi:thiamine pyrophosphate-dependent acetolactate synthase large subunit-like protein
LLTRESVVLAVHRFTSEVRGCIFVSNGYETRAYASLADHPEAFYLFGGMGLTGAVACGFSHATQRPTLVLEGDGNTLMGLAALPVIAAHAHPPFSLVVVDNERYEATGDQPTGSAAVDMGGIARASGFDYATNAITAFELEAALRVVAANAAIGFIRCRVGRTEAPFPRVNLLPAGVAQRFRQAVDTGSTSG